MTGAVQEISTDYDLDYDDDAPREDPLKILDDEIDDIKQFGEQLGVLIESTMAIDQFGMTPTSFAVMKTSDLLSGTALESLGVEHFANVGTENFESEMALEALVDKIKEKTAAWGAKILSFVKKAGDRILGGLTSVMDKVTGYAKSLTAKAWDTAKLAGATIKAHPVKTILAVIAAAAVVAGIVIMCSSAGSFADKNTIKTLMGRIKESINGKLTAAFGVHAEVVPVTTRSFEVYTVATRTTHTVTYAVETKTITELGWTQTAVKGVMAQLSTAWSSVKSGVTTLANPAVSVVKKLDAIGGDMKDVVGATVTHKTGSKLAGWAANKWVDKLYTTALFSVIGVVTKLLQSVVMKAFYMVRDTFKSLTAKVETA